MKTPDTSELLGKTISYVTVMHRVADRVRPNGKRRPVYLCKCVCGREVEIESQTLRVDRPKSCGCKRLPTGVHWEEGTAMVHWKARSSYQHMLGRCYNPKECGFEEYGGRGITVCDEWKESFWNFLRDMGERPENHAIDRIDPDGNYEPLNCRWVNRNLSSFNTRKASNNTSGRTGVYWFARVEKWVAAIVFKGTQHHLGYFLEYEDAVKAREAAEMLYYGELKSG